MNAPLTTNPNAAPTARQAQKAAFEANKLAKHLRREVCLLYTSRRCIW